MASICAASAPVRASGLVHTIPLPAAAAMRVASRCTSLGSEITTRSTAGSAHSAAMSSYWCGIGPQVPAKARARARSRE